MPPEQNKEPLEYKGEIIERLGKGFIWNSIAWPTLEMALQAIEIQIAINKPLLPNTDNTVK